MYLRSLKMGAIHRVIPDDRPGQVWWFHGNSGSGKTNIALKFDVPNKIVLDADDFRESVWDDLGFDEKSRRKQNDRLARICPYKDQRKQIRKEILPDVKWIYVNSKDSKPNSKEYPFEEGW
jgi:adenylylsulfate kinase-like enzyme